MALSIVLHELRSFFNKYLMGRFERKPKMSATREQMMKGEQKRTNETKLSSKF